MKFEIGILNISLVFNVLSYVCMYESYDATGSGNVMVRSNRYLQSSIKLYFTKRPFRIEMNMYARMEQQKERKKLVLMADMLLFLLLVKWECKPSKLSPYACFTALFNAHPPPFRSSVHLYSFLATSKERMGKERFRWTHKISQETYSPQIESPPSCYDSQPYSF